MTNARQKKRSAGKRPKNTSKKKPNIQGASPASDSIEQEPSNAGSIVVSPCLRLKLTLGKTLPVSPPSETGDNIRSSLTPPPPLSETEVEATKKTVNELLGYTCSRKSTSASSQTNSVNKFLDAKDTFEGGVSDEKKSAAEGQINGESGIEDEDTPGPLSGHESESEDEVFDVKFRIPVGGADDVIIIPSNTSWTEFLSNVANIISVAPKKVSIAYRFSTDTRSTHFMHLSKATHLLELFQCAQDVKKTSRSKKAKDFSVEIKNLDETQGKKKSKSSKKVDGRKGKKHSRGESDDSQEESTDEDSDHPRGKVTRIDGKNIHSSKKRSGAQWVAQLEKENACNEHDGKPCVKFVSGHYQLSKADLSSWSLYLMNGYESTTTPPPNLKISDAAPHSRAVATAPPANQMQPSGTGQPAQAQTPLVPNLNMYAHPPLPGPFYAYPPYSPYMPYPQSQFPPPQMTPMGHHSRYYGGQSDIPSSDPPEEPDNLTIFPPIMDWLQALDNGPYGRDGHNFSQFGDDLEKEKFVRICDLESLTEADLFDLCPGIAKGTAAKLLDFAKKDTKRIRKEERKQFCHAGSSKKSLRW